MRRLSGFARQFGIIALFVAAAIGGTASGVVFAFAGDLPQIEALDDYAPSTITRVYARDGAVIGDFAEERRTIVGYEEIPPVLREAFIAAEDGNFLSHIGVDPTRIAITAVRRVLGLQRYGGASTITQQLSRKLFLTDEQTLERKIREAILAVQIEKRYTKEEILTMYCNKMYWGHGAYGVEAASQLFFAKHASELTLGEAAMIAGIHQGNYRQSPYVNMAAAVQRRDYTLRRMVAEGFITSAQADEAIAQPIVTHGEPNRPPSIAPYFLETLRIHLEDEYGSKALYESGLTVRTGLDPDLQRAANAALDSGLRTIDKRHGYRKPTRNIVAEGGSIETFRHRRWLRDILPGDIVPAVVMNVDDTDILVRVDEYTGTIGRAGYAWTRGRARDLAAPGDLVELRVEAMNEEHMTFTATLDQQPSVEGAVLAIENRTGQVLAMIGGESFERSQFNRATQALRQVGSLFKPFVFTAAIDRGYTAQSLLDDSPASFEVGPGQPLYQPRNYDHEYHGMVTIREALEGSRNVPTIRLMAALGPRQVVNYARQLGITAPLPEFLSVAIGSAEASLMEMTSAYSAYPNQGVRMEPLIVLEVLDRDGNTLEQHRSQPHQAIRADTAYIITNLLTGVVQNGTAASARALDWPLGGKTGTTDDYTDAWFVGFDPDITVGVWIGFDQKRSMGAAQTGTGAALPVWRDIMRSWIERRREALPEPPEFTRPGNIVLVRTSHGPEVFIAGTETAED
jgi:penicillin-binding protein 1A